MYDLKASVAAYVPTKGDQIDKALAENINNQPEARLKVMFLREAPGVYEFGSRKVMIKLEREKLQVKVGGSTLSIEEFLEQYTPKELRRNSNKYIISNAP